MRILPAAAAAMGLAASVALTAPALAHGDRDRPEQKRTEYTAGLNVPVAMSPSVSLVDSNPGSAGISGCFMKTAPLFVMSGLDSVVVHDISNPLDPQQRRDPAKPAVRERGDELRRAQGRGHHPALRPDRRRPLPRPPRATSSTSTTPCVGTMSSSSSTSPTPRRRRSARGSRRPPAPTR
ncbi:hypothetical protein [Nocardioides sp. B-3]|uniref:hypothetical protein n=1 Tax=Nocardioides sp. B-3 TaxID=2895565 RepID=UPI0021526299|nr:hypothetical protein [Nocardioides sp. B-3]UUZ59860.1 hypothetical protein LP418_01995 [Nocardioides sp. B-3]